MGGRSHRWYDNNVMLTEITTLYKHGEKKSISECATCWILRWMDYNSRRLDLGTCPSAQNRNLRRTQVHQNKIRIGVTSQGLYTVCICPMLLNPCWAGLLLFCPICCNFLPHVYLKGNCMIAYNKTKTGCQWVQIHVKQNSYISSIIALIGIFN